MEDSLVNKVDEEIERLGVKSRNNYIEQMIRHHLKIPSIFDEKVEG